MALAIRIIFYIFKNELTLIDVFAKLYSMICLVSCLLENTESTSIHTESTSIHTESTSIHTESTSIHTESTSIHTESTYYRLLTPNKKTFRLNVFVNHIRIIFYIFKNELTLIDVFAKLYSMICLVSCRKYKYSHRKYN
jgi:hypothetical protein